MKLVLDAFWRAFAYCLHPRVMLASLFPLLLMVTGLGLLGYLFWEPALDQVRQWLESFELLHSAWSFLERFGMGGLKPVLAPMLVILVVTPVVVISSLLLVALVMMPALVRLVAARRFSHLQALRGASFWRSALWSLAVSLAALLACLLTLPLWLLPPVALVLPALIWGWLTAKVMAFDALAEHASAQERRTLLREHAAPLLVMGILCGYLGAAPSLIWSMGMMVIVWAPVLLPLSVWLYTLVFAFSSLWFVHYCLAALEGLRMRTPGHVSEDAAVLPAPTPDPPTEL
jgi:hypothetical protein